MPITFDVPDDLAKQLEHYESQIPRILELGIREWQARRETSYDGMSGILEKLAALPSPEEILALRPAPALQERLDALLEKSRTTGLSPDDQREWDDYEYVEHLVRLAKASALRKLKEAAP